MSINILVLSEDTGQGHETVTGVLERLLHVWGPKGEREVKFLPIDDGEGQVKEAMYSSHWKSNLSRLQPYVRQLRRMIAQKLAEGWLVAFHFDGDRVWDQQASSENAEKFNRLIRPQVFELLRSRGFEACIDDLIEVTPFYSIEAWTYQATNHAITFCHNRGSCKCEENFTAWAADRTALDDVYKVKDSACFKGKHNAELALKIPVREVVAADRSLAELARRLETRPRLKPLLRVQVPISAG